MPGIVEAVVRRKEPSSTIIGTVSLWNNAISHELEKSPDSQITCVELATFRDQGAYSKTSNEKDILRRQGIVSLGRALRQLLLHASLGTEPMISWRESTLTHVLQRRLECSKVVVLGSISQLSKDYELTLGTLNYLRRLLIKPGETASSPFRNRDAVQEHQMSDENSNGVDDTTPSNRLHEYARSPQLLEQIVADPRQRLAKLFKCSSPIQGFPEINYAPSEDDYQAIDYMDYEGGRVENETISDSTETGSIDEKKSGVVNSARHSGEPYELGERLEPSTGIVEPKTPSLIDQSSMEKTDGNALRPNNQHVGITKWNNPESIQFDRPFDPYLPQKNLHRLEIGASSSHQLTMDSEGIYCKTGIQDGTANYSAPRGDYSIGSASEVSTVEQKIMGIKNESQEQPSQRNEHSFHTVLSSQASDISDNMALSHSKYEYVAAIDESSASTLGSGVGCKTMIVKPDTPGADHSTKMLENSSGPHLDTNIWHQDGRENTEIDSKTMLEVNVGMLLKKEAESLRDQHGCEQKRHEEDIQHLQNQLDHVLDEKKNVEKIAEEVISSQADLEKQLLESRNELFKVIGDADLLRSERVHLLQEQEELRQRLESMSGTMQASENVKRLHESQRRELQHTIEEMKDERDNLKQILRDNERVIGDLMNGNQQILIVQDEQRKEKHGLIVAVEEKDLELQLAHKQIEALTSAQKDLEKDKSKIKHLYSHEQKEVSLLKKHLQNVTIKCSELNANLVGCVETVRKLQDNLKLVKSSEEKLQSRIRELEQDRDRSYEKIKVLGTTTKNLEQMNLSVQEMKEQHDRYEKQHRADQTTISELKQELISEKAKRSFTDRQRDEVVFELRSIRKATTEVEKENANLYKHNLGLLGLLEETKKDANSGIMSLEDKNQELRSRLGECTATLLTCQIEKNDIENVLKRYNDQVGAGGGGRLSRGSSLLHGFEENNSVLKQILAEYKEKMNADLVHFRSRANEKLHKVRARHEKVVRESEELQFKFAGLEEQVLLLEKENAKLRYHRKKCLDELKNGRDRVVLIGEANPPSTLSVLGRHKLSESGSRILRLVPELYLTKSSVEF